MIAFSRSRHPGATLAVRSILLQHARRAAASTTGTSSSQPPPPSGGRAGPRGIRKAILSSKFAASAEEALAVKHQQQQQREAARGSAQPDSVPATTPGSGEGEGAAAPAATEVPRDALASTTTTSNPAPAAPPTAPPTAPPPPRAAAAAADGKKGDSSDDSWVLRVGVGSGSQPAVSRPRGSTAVSSGSGDGDTGKAPKAGPAGGTASGLSPAGAKPSYKIKVKQRPPWGERQLRDSWSADAMAKLKWGNINERMFRENRYHPDEWLRHMSKYLLYLSPIVVCVSAQWVYGRLFGRWIWEGDFQYVLNLIRHYDTSPRSKKFSIDNQVVDLDDVNLPWSNRERQPAHGVQQPPKEALLDRSIFLKNTVV